MGYNVKGKTLQTGNSAAGKSLRRSYKRNSIRKESKLFEKPYMVKDLKNLNSNEKKVLAVNSEKIDVLIEQEKKTTRKLRV